MERQGSISHVVAVMRRALVVLAVAACGPKPSSTPTVAPPHPEPAAPVAPGEPAPPASAEPVVKIPVEMHTLDNGLRVVLSPDSTAPIVAVTVYYGIGFRIEPRGRTGFAHLFEHLMFQGSENLAKGEFNKLIAGNGGLSSGSTRFDFTVYYETVPSHVLETVLWAEADRMRSPAVTEESLRNQKDVVSNEIRVKVLNQPYGGFPLLTMPQIANSNWYNAHNFYGDLADLEAAQLDDVQQFFRTYYVPANAVLTIVGDFDRAKTLEWVQRYFGDIPGGARPTLPDLSEPVQTAERRHAQTAPKADRPALAVAWHMPERGTPEFWAMAWVHQILASGRDSLLHQSLVQQHGYTGGVVSSINTLGSQFNYRGPMLFDVSLFHDSGTSAEQILAAIDEETTRLAAAPVDAATYARAKVKVRSHFYNLIDKQLDRAGLISATTLFDGDPQRVNQIERRLMSVTPEQIQAAARQILRKDNRTVVQMVPGKKDQPASAQKESK